MRIGEIKIYLFAIGLVSTYVVIVLIGEHRIRAAANHSNDYAAEVPDELLFSKPQFIEASNELYRMTEVERVSKIAEGILASERELRNQSTGSSSLFIQSKTDPSPSPPIPTAETVNDGNSASSKTAAVEDQHVADNSHEAIREVVHQYYRHRDQDERNTRANPVALTNAANFRPEPNSFKQQNIDTSSSVERIPANFRSVLDDQLCQTQQTDYGFKPAYEGENEFSDRFNVNVELAEARLQDSEIPAGNDETNSKPTWPRSQVLHDDLDKLAEFELTFYWVARTRQLLEQLEQTTIEDHQTAARIVLQLNRLSQEVDGILRSIPRQNLQAQSWQELFSDLAQIQVKLQRRVQMWNQTAALMGTFIEPIAKPNASAVLNATLASDENLKVYANSDQWRLYFELDKLKTIFGDGDFTDRNRQAISRIVLGRVTAPGLDEAQYRFATDVLSEQLIEQLQDAACEPVDFHQLLSRIENYEADPQGSDAYRLNGEFLNLYFSRRPEYRQVAAVMDNLYRNANIRISVADDLINRTLPVLPEMTEPVTDRILGAQVFGNNRIQNRLQIKFLPNAEQINVRLMTTGSVLSRTRALHSGFTFHNSGNSRFHGISDIAVTKQGVLANSAKVSASTDQQLLGIKSNVDNIPLLGWVARQVAEQQQKSSAPLANKLVEEKLRTLTRSRVDEEIKTKLADAQASFIQKVLTPLNSLELEPTAVELRTTADEAIVRYRIAGRDQMASHTARPQAIPGNLMSVQLHESALNNILNKIDINGKKFTPIEFTEHLRDVLGRPDFMLSEHPPENPDAQFTFQSLDGIHVRFIDGTLQISLNLKHLRLGDNRQWKHFRVAARYVPQVRGMQVRFVLDPEQGLSLISLTGSQLGISDQIALRTIFNSSFPEVITLPPLNQMLPAALPTDDLFIGQFVFANGWLGISLNGEQEAPTVETPRSAIFERSRIFR